MNLQNAAIVVSLLIGGGGLGLGVLNFRRDAERLALDRERRAEERKGTLPDLRLVRETLRVSRVQILPEDVPSEALVEISARVYSGPKVFHAGLEVRYDGERCVASYGRSVEIEANNPEPFSVTVPFSWTEVAADDVVIQVAFDPWVFENRHLRRGATIRVWDEHSGAEDAITVE